MDSLGGVYRLLCTKTGQQYIGSTYNREERKRQHFTALDGNRHFNKNLQNLYNTYGKEVFVFEDIELWGIIIPGKAELDKIAMAKMQQEGGRLINEEISKKLIFNVPPQYPAVDTLKDAAKTKESERI